MALGPAAQARLVGVRDHLVQMRVGYQEIIDETWPGRIGAAELERSRRTVRLRIARVPGEVGRDLVSRADHRIEPRKSIVAVERDADLVLQFDLGDVEAAARRHRELGRDVEGVGRVDAGVAGRRQQAHRCNVAGRLIDEHAGAGNEQVLTDGAELAVAGELHPAVIETDADHEMVVVLQHALGARGLHRSAKTVRGGPGPVDLAEYRSGGERVENGISVAVDEQRVCGAQAQILRRRRRSPWERAARGGLRGVGIDVFLPESAIVHMALERQRVGRLVASVPGQERQIVLRGLRPGIDVLPTPAQQLDRRHRDSREIVGSSGEIDVKLALFIARAHIRVHPAQP